MHLLRRRRVPADERSFQRPPGGGELLLHPLAQCFKFPKVHALNVAHSPGTGLRDREGRLTASPCFGRSPCFRARPDQYAQDWRRARSARGRGARACASRRRQGHRREITTPPSTVRPLDGNAREVRLLCECGILPIRISIHLFRSF
jgi:hypothetical protein